jgi:hypothetical protein
LGVGRGGGGPLAALLALLGDGGLRGGGVGLGLRLARPGQRGGQERGARQERGEAWAAER